MPPETFVLPADPIAPGRNAPFFPLHCLLISREKGPENKRQHQGPRFCLKNSQQRTTAGKHGSIRLDRSC